MRRVFGFPLYPVTTVDIDFLSDVKSRVATLLIYLFKKSE